MAEPYAQHSGALQAFHTWTQSPEARMEGITGPDFETNCYFISQSNLQKYFERPGQFESLLDDVLNSKARHAVDSDFLRQHYARSFAILLHIGAGPMIENFQHCNSLRDEKLPHRSRPEDFPITTPDKFDDFRKAQWRYCASTLEYGMNSHFKEDDILPIIRREPIGEGGSSNVYKIVVDEAYNRLRPAGLGSSDGPSHHRNTFVLKTYRPTEDAGKDYNAEYEAHMKLRFGTIPPLHIVTHYGGFVHGKTYNNILEFADEGTLEDFMRTTKPPTIPEDVLLLWDRLFDVIHGVMSIHGKSKVDCSSSQFLIGMHQDIKPANILVFRGKGNSPYDRHFKIGDLVLTSFQPSASQSNDPTDFEAFGTRAYGAPETYRFHRDTGSAPLQVPQSVDIWSLGCIFSEVSVWACYGWNRVVEYRHQRSIEIETNNGSSGEHVFYYGGKLLDVVVNTHNTIVENAPASHRITKLVLDQYVKRMLRPGARLPAHYLFEESKELIMQVSKAFGVNLDKLMGYPGSELGGVDQTTVGRQRGFPQEEPPSPDNDSAPPSPPRSQHFPHRPRHRPMSQSQNRLSHGLTQIPQSSEQHPHVQRYSTNFGPAVSENNGNPQGQHLQQSQGVLKPPTLSIEEGHDWKKKKKARQYAVLRGSENMPCLNQRDHIFLIDNSNTMRGYRKDIASVVSLLAYMLKGSDDDGLDIFFTQNSRKINSKKSKKLTEAIDDLSFIGISDMRGRLRNILQPYINKFGTSVQPTRWFGRQPATQSQRPISIYILTDGKYQPNNVGGLIKELVRNMEANRLPKEHVALSFIRFGEDQTSIDRLDRLDSGLGLKAIGMDIVDHTYWKGDVWKMLLGPLNDWYDDDPPDPVQPSSMNGSW